MKVLSFDISGKYGHFKKFYTTSSPLTFYIPPPTAIYGMLGAIMGLDKGEYLKHINAETTKVAIRILLPLKKVRISLNYIDTKNSGSFNLIKSRTQIRKEFLKDPAYRIYTYITNENLFEKLYKLLKQGFSYYTLSLGMANLLAVYRFNGVYESKFIDGSDRVDSVILRKNIDSGILKMKDGYRFSVEKLPLNITENREILAYDDVIMEISGKALEGRFKNCYYLNGGEIISFIN